MRCVCFNLPAAAITAFVAVFAPPALAFEGRIKAVVLEGTETTPLLYTVSPNFLRIEVVVTNQPNPVDIVDLNSGALMLLFPHSRGFVRLKPGAGSSAITPVGPPEGGTPNLTPPGGLPPRVGPQSPAAPGLGVPAMPPMPIMPTEKFDLKATGEKTNLLGFVCARYELKQPGQTLEIWATDQLLPFQSYVRNQPPSFGPRLMGEQWPVLLTAKRLFPLRACLRFDNGAERFRFEVKSVALGKLAGEDAKLFQPPSDYVELQPMSF